MSSFMWIAAFEHDPTSFLSSSSDPAMQFWVGRLLKSKMEDPANFLWDLHAPQILLKKQQSDGCWIYKGNRPGDAYGEKYELLETWRNLNILVEIYGFNRRHPAIEKACEYILSYQTEEGDIRGILSNQYIPYYMGVMVETLIKAGFGKDPRVERCIRWLESQQQDGGGWIIPMMMFKMSQYYDLCQKDPIPPNRTLAFSHMATGMVIRAFAAHPDYCKSTIARETGRLLKQRFFRKDTFTSRQAISYWTKFQIPFWWTNLLTCLDSLARIGFDRSDEDIHKGLNWFVEHQNQDGGWSSNYAGKVGSTSNEWITFAVCRVFKAFYL